MVSNRLNYCRKSASSHCPQAYPLDHRKPRLLRQARQRGHCLLFDPKQILALLTGPHQRHYSNCSTCTSVSSTLQPRNLFSSDCAPSHRETKCSLTCHSKFVHYNWLWTSDSSDIPAPNHIGSQALLHIGSVSSIRQHETRVYPWRHHVRVSYTEADGHWS